ncbi:hypothetical protein B0J12DRAFT_704078 [Macrophomina phaseolina]|uniref:Uncharacterized protein n=1 Tax=Macrophomina phaseolina TaxID=35725 RepID=A0ABQ8FWR0_9PEZI|nr:hypothetical protein B0J12DRAFT_704078 [Macrophomina phaseolina]
MLPQTHRAALSTAHYLGVAQLWIAAVSVSSKTTPPSGAPVTRLLVCAACPRRRRTRRSRRCPPAIRDCVMDDAVLLRLAAWGQPVDDGELWMYLRRALDVECEVRALRFHRLE